MLTVNELNISLGQHIQKLRSENANVTLQDWIDDPKKLIEKCPVETVIPYHKKPATYQCRSSFYNPEQTDQNRASENTESNKLAFTIADSKIWFIELTHLKKEFLNQKRQLRGNSLGDYIKKRNAIQNKLRTVTYSMDVLAKYIHQLETKSNPGTESGIDSHLSTQIQSMLIELWVEKYACDILNYQKYQENYLYNRTWTHNVKSDNSILEEAEASILEPIDTQVIKDLKVRNRKIRNSMRNIAILAGAVSVLTLCVSLLAIATPTVLLVTAPLSLLAGLIALTAGIVVVIKHFQYAQNGMQLENHERSEHYKTLKSKLEEEKPSQATSSAYFNKQRTHTI